MIFYHVDRKKLLKSDQTIDYIQLPSDSAHEILSYCNNHFPDGLSSIGFIYTYAVNPQDFRYPAYASEIFLELYRQWNFPELPSRFQSICASNSIDQAINWYKHLNLQSANLVTFESEKYLKADASWRDLIAGNLNISTIELWAHNYWSGVVYLNAPRIEYLVKLPIKVKSIKPIDFIHL